MGPDPSAGSAVKCPSARNSGCPLWPPGVRLGSVGPGVSGWGPRTPSSPAPTGPQVWRPQNTWPGFNGSCCEEEGVGMGVGAWIPTAHDPLVSWGPQAAPGLVRDQSGGKALIPPLRQSRSRHQVAGPQRIGKGPAGPSGAAPEEEDMPVSPVRLLLPTPIGHRAGRSLSGTTTTCPGCKPNPTKVWLSVWTAYPHPSPAGTV